MNSILEAQELYFEGRILQMAIHMPDSMLFKVRGMPADVEAKEHKEYLQRCVNYVADQQTLLWDHKLREDTK